MRRRWRTALDPQLRDLVHVGTILVGTIVIVGLLVVLGILGWRAYQVKRHGRVSKQRRYEATQIDLFRKREGRDAGGGDAAGADRDRRRRRGRGSSANHSINLFESKSEAATGAAAGDAAEDETRD